jgi:hypothetical protein
MECHLDPRFPAALWVTIEPTPRLMHNLAELISTYVRETRRLEALPSSTETTFYPDLKALLNGVLKSERLPFDVITGMISPR